MILYDVGRVLIFAGLATIGGILWMAWRMKL